MIHFMSMLRGRFARPVRDNGVGMSGPTDIVVCSVEARARRLMTYSTAAVGTTAAARTIRTET